MPSRDKLDRFNKSLNALSNEGRWRADRGESMDRVVATAGLESDLAPLSDRLPPFDLDAVGEAFATEPTVAPPVSDPNEFSLPTPSDFDSNFDSDAPASDPLVDRLTGTEDPGIASLDESAFGADDLFGAESRDTDAFNVNTAPIEDIPLPEETPDFDAGGPSLGEMPDFSAAGASVEDDIPELSREESPFGPDDSSGFDGESGGSFGEAFDPDQNAAFDTSDFGSVFDEKPKRESVVDPSVEEEIESDELAFSARQVKRIEESLERMPRNLRLVLEEVLADESLPSSTLKSLSNKLIRMASARALAEEVRRITGRIITVPLFYEHMSGADYEKKTRSFSYVFLHEAWPKLQVALFVILVCWLFALGVFHLVYRPLAANARYAGGYEAISKREFPVAASMFKSAFDGWPLGPFQISGLAMKKWFFKYAEAYADQKRADLADEKYEQLLILYPKLKKAFLTYGNYASSLGLYAKADAIYARYLNEQDPADKDILLARGDNLMIWAKLDKDKLEVARQVFGLLFSRYGDRTEILSRFLGYFLRVGDERQINFLVNYFEIHKRGFVDARVFSMVAGRYIDKGLYAEANDALERALKSNEAIPDVHYQFARYFYALGDIDKEREALQRTLFYLSKTALLDDRDIADMRIHTYASLADVNAGLGEEREAENGYLYAISLYESVKARKVIEPTAAYGEIYAKLADLYYGRTHDYDTAFIYYDKALANMFDGPDLRYKRAYIAYRRFDYETALMDFNKAHEVLSGNDNVAFSLSATLVRRGDYAAAIAILEALRAKLEAERTEDPEGFAAAEDSGRMAKLQALMRVYNNLGVALFALGERSSDQGETRIAAQRAFSRSLWYRDLITRTPETLERDTSPGLPTRNFTASIQIAPPALFDSLPSTLTESASSWGQ